MEIRASISISGLIPFSANVTYNDFHVWEFCKKLMSSIAEFNTEFFLLIGIVIFEILPLFVI